MVSVQSAPRLVTLVQSRTGTSGNAPAETHVSQQTKNLNQNPTVEVSSPVSTRISSQLMSFMLDQASVESIAPVSSVSARAENAQDDADQNEAGVERPSGGPPPGGPPPGGAPPSGGPGGAKVSGSASASESALSLLTEADETETEAAESNAADNSTTADDVALELLTDTKASETSTKSTSNTSLAVSLLYGLDSTQDDASSTDADAAMGDPDGDATASVSDATKAGTAKSTSLNTSQLDAAASLALNVQVDDAGLYTYSAAA
jgi:hypothetical protein